MTIQKKNRIKNSVRDAIHSDLNVVYEKAPNIYDDAPKSERNEVTISEKREFRENKNDEDSYVEQDNSTISSSETLNYDDVLCENIDDAMCGLHSLIPDVNFDISVPRTLHASSVMSTISSASQSVHHQYDWILDGDPDIEEESDEEEENVGEASVQRSIVEEERRKLGDEELEKVLAGLELESTPLSLSSNDRNNLPQKKTEDKLQMKRQKSFVSNHHDDGSQSYKNMDKSLVLVDNESLILTPKAHNQTPNKNSKSTGFQNSKEIGDFDCILDYLPPIEKNNLYLPGSDLSCSITPKTHSRCSNDIDEDESILDHLPFEDPSTPEGKFFRHLKSEREQSLHSMKETETVEFASLTSQFFLQEFDPILDLLQSLPWENKWWDNKEEDIQPCKDETNTEEFSIIQVDNFLTEKLSLLDEVSDEVTNELLFHIKQKDQEIKERMDLMLAIDCDVTNAISLVKEANLHLQRARGRDKIQIGARDGISGGLRIIEEANCRDKLRSVDSLLKSCEELFDLERSITEMRSQLDAEVLLSRNGFMISLIGLCNDLKGTILRDGHLLRLHCLDEMRERVSKVMDSLRKRLEDGLVSFVSHRCASFHLSATEKWNEELRREYKSLLKARYLLHDYHVSEVIENKNENSNDDEELPNVAIEWSGCIIKALCFEAERCLARALVDPTSFDDNTVFNSCGEFDENLIEMRKKLNQLQAFDKDAKSIRSMTMNLLSIRFEFEKRTDLLPWVFHKLCSLLADVMHTHYLLAQCHEEVMDDNSIGLNKSISDAIQRGKVDVWTHCKSLITFMFRVYIDLTKAKDAGSFRWAQELENHYDVLKLCHHISCFAHEFIHSDRSASFDPNFLSHDLREVLSIMFETYVQNAHINAMTEIGTMMANDTWDILPIPMQKFDDENLIKTEQVRRSVQHFLLKDLQKSEIEADRFELQLRPWHNMIELNHCHNSLFEYFSDVGNPFMLKRIVNDEGGDQIEPMSSGIDNSCAKGFYDILSQIINDDDTRPMLGTRTALNGVGRWTVRLLTIRSKLPLVSDKIVGVIRHIYDLYFLTVFRLCIGNADDEDIILGNTKRSDAVFNDQFPRDLPPTKTQAKAVNLKQVPSLRKSQSFSRARQPSDNLSRSHSSRHTLVTRHCNADIYFPLKTEENLTTETRTFIRRAQASLTGIIDLDQIQNWKLMPSGACQINNELEADAVYLQKRVTASFSCLFLVCLFEVAFHTNQFSFETKMARDAPFINYLNQMMAVVPHVHLLCMRMSTIRAIRGEDIVTKVSCKKFISPFSLRKIACTNFLF